jgi:aldose 1-epimerase
MLHIIENDFWKIGVLPATGASVAFGRIKRGGNWLDFMRPTPESSYPNARATASYVLAPWSNRIRDGRFRFRGHEYRLRVNYPDGTAIHGTANEFPWTVETAEPSCLVATFKSMDFAGVNFPWQFSVRVAFELDGRRFSLKTWLRNEDTTAIPAGFGHHPYFLRGLGEQPDSVQLEIPCAEYFVLENCLPSAGPVPIPANLDFLKLRPIGGEFIDNALAGRTPGKPIRFVYPEAAITLHTDDIFQNVILYAPVEKPYFAVEPVTNANDGFNLYDRGIPGSGVFVLEPGEEKQGAYVFQIEE